MQNIAILLLDVAVWQKVEKMFKENVCFDERDTFQVHFEAISNTGCLIVKLFKINDRGICRKIENINDIFQET